MGRSGASKGPIRSRAGAKARGSNPSSSSASVSVARTRAASKAPSSRRETESGTVAIRSRPDEPSSFPVIETTGIPSCFRIDASPTTSSVSPEYDSARHRSLGRNAPRSPCAASEGCTGCEAIPSDLSVAAIFAPTSPDLPRPAVSRSCSVIEGDVAACSRTTIGETRNDGVASGVPAMPTFRSCTASATPDASEAENSTARRDAFMKKPQGATRGNATDARR